MKPLFFPAPHEIQKSYLRAQNMLNTHNFVFTEAFFEKLIHQKLFQKQNYK